MALVAVLVVAGKMKPDEGASLLNLLVTLLTVLIAFDGRPRR